MSQRQVLLPGSLLPRRADATQVIGAALLAKARGRGWRRIAAELGCPPATVRRWLRAVRGPHTLPGCAGAASSALPGSTRRSWPTLTPTELGDALAAFSAAVVAWRHRFGQHAGARTLIGVFAGGRLLTPL